MQDSGQFADHTYIHTYIHHVKKQNTQPNTFSFHLLLRPPSSPPPARINKRKHSLQLLA
jgi:hypothetical protein